MRIRTIKPRLFKDEELAALAYQTRLLFIGLFCAADKNGVMEDRPKMLKSEIFPYEDCDVSEMLDTLEKNEFIKRFIVGEKPYLYVVNFRKHQRISGKEFQDKSELPEPPCDLKQTGSNGEATEKQMGRTHCVQEQEQEQEGKGLLANESPSGENAPYIIKTSLQAVVCGYKELTGVPYNDRAWDELNFKRFAKSGAALLKFFNNNQEHAINCIDSIKKWAEGKKIDWTLETVCKRASDYKTGRL